MNENKKLIDQMHKMAVDNAEREFIRIHMPPMINLSKKQITKTILYPGHAVKIGFFDRLQMRWSGIEFWFRKLWKNHS